MTRQDIETIYPVSATQQGMLVHSLDDPSSGHYIQQMVCSFREDLDLTAFIKAWNEVVSRHGVFRTGFDLSSTLPAQVVHRSAKLEIVQHDWRTLNDDDTESRLADQIRIDRLRGFELSSVPLMRLAIFRLNRCYKVLWTYHHALMDGRSRLLVLRELFSLYDSYRDGTKIELEPTRPYSDYIEWLKGYDLHAAEKFWRQVLHGFDSPTIVELGQVRDAKEGLPTIQEPVEARLTKSATNALKLFAEKAGVTLSTLVQGGWSILLSRYTREENIVFGTIRACRSFSASAGSMVGLFMNTLPVRVRISCEDLVLPWLQRLRASQVALRPYEHTPLAKIHEWNKVPYGRSLFESLVVFERYDLNRALREAGDGWKNREFRLIERTNYPLVLKAYDGDELILKIAHDPSRFDNSTIERMLGHLTTLLEGLPNNAQGRVRALPLMSEDEQRQLSFVRSETKVESSSQCVHEMFESQVERSPDKIALVCGENQLTYRELNNSANQLARYLKRLGVGIEDRVGICLERSTEMMIAALGTMKAGGSYVPLDPAFPKERLAFMINDANLKVLLTQEDLVNELPGRRAKIALDSVWESVAQESAENLMAGATLETLAYVIYTSGSTGKPKGVQIEHRALTNFLCSMRKMPGLTSEDILLAVTTFSFDIAALELYLPLIVGARLVMASREVASDGIQLRQKLEDCAATVMQATPITWRMLLDAGWQADEEGFTALCGGEALSRKLANELTDARASLWNMYGPTETTIWSGTCEVASGSEPISIGEPIANTEFYILDEELEQVPIGIAGQLFVGGDGLARGYLNHPELTAEKFVPHPFSSEPGARLYKTGDLTRFQPDGPISFLGRIDHQVKLNGYRIELGDIEVHLRQHEVVRDAVVLMRESEQGKQDLVAYVVVSMPADEATLVRKLKSSLKEKLPAYMVPAYFIFLESLPLTPNGKLDRRALPAPVRATPELALQVAPRDELESHLALIWQQVLEVESLSINDNFFELGGHSLQATQAISRIRQALHIELPVSALFESPTVAGLSGVVREAQLRLNDTRIRVISPLSRESFRVKLSS